MGNAEEKYSMQKLEGPSNWRTWKIQIKAVLVEKKLWNHVDGTARLENGAEANVRERFENLQHSAYTKLIMSVSTPMVALCQTCVTAVDVWTTLTKQFDKNTNLSKLRGAHSADEGTNSPLWDRPYQKKNKL